MYQRTAAVVVRTGKDLDIAEVHKHGIRQQSGHESRDCLRRQSPRPARHGVRYGEDIRHTQSGPHIRGQSRQRHKGKPVVRIPHRLRRTAQVPESRDGGGTEPSGCDTQRGDKERKLLLLHAAPSTPYHRNITSARQRVRQVRQPRQSARPGRQAIWN